MMMVLLLSVEQGTDRLILRTPDRVTIANWVTDAHPTITEDIIKNAWRKTGLSYFRNEEVIVKIVKKVYLKLGFFTLEVTSHHLPSYY